jgi:hypothetical protein
VERFIDVPSVFVLTLVKVFFDYVLVFLLLL